MLVYLLGLACVAWTIFELAALVRAASEAQRRAGVAVANAPQSEPAGRARSRRIPLAAWDDRGRPITVEDVSTRGAR